MSELSRVVEKTYRLRKPHQAIEWNWVIGKVIWLWISNTELVTGQVQPSNGDIVCDDCASNVTSTVRNGELFPRVLECTWRRGTEESMWTLQGNEKGKHWLHITRLTHPPPAVDVQLSDPTHKSAEPESMRIKKSWGGVPIWMVARYPTSWPLERNLRTSHKTRFEMNALNIETKGVASGRCISSLNTAGNPISFNFRASTSSAVVTSSGSCRRSLTTRKLNRIVIGIL